VQPDAFIPPAQRGGIARRRAVLLGLFELGTLLLVAPDGHRHRRISSIERLLLRLVRASAARRSGPSKTSSRSVFPPQFIEDRLDAPMPFAAGDSNLIFDFETAEADRF
jgi:hypothetical protein